MKKYYYLLVASCFSMNVSAQNTANLNENNVSLELQDEGFFFSDILNGTGGYEVPAGSGNNLIYSSAFWVGGIDINGQTKLAAQKYHANGQDYWSGPLKRYYAEEFAVNPFGQTIWSVSKAEINYHQSNYSSPGYVIPNDIANWPVMGDSSFCSDSTFCEIPYYAPFVDFDGDGEYNPELGDYPCIKGDRAIYMILNDRGDIHASGGDIIGVEMRYMFYQFNTVPELENVTFIDLEIVNAGTQTVYDFNASYFLDADIGNPNDDFVGCDTLRNMIYAYNGDSYDEAWVGGPGYGIPPALGVISLNNDMANSSYFLNGGSVVQQDPVSSPEYLNVMRGNWKDGSIKQDGNGNSTPFMYYGDPSNPVQWSEVSLANIPGDRRMILSNELGDLTPSIGGLASGSRNLSYAIIFAQGTDNLNSVTKLFSSADFVQDYFDGMKSNCFDETILSINEGELNELDFNMYPNPSSGVVNVDFKDQIGEVRISVVDLSGREVYANTYSNISATQFQINEGAGVYFVQVLLDGYSTVKKMVIE